MNIMMNGGGREGIGAEGRGGESAQRYVKRSNFPPSTYAAARAFGGDWVNFPLAPLARLPAS